MLLGSKCYTLAFPTGRDSATFRDKGTTGQAKKSCQGTGRDKTGRDSQNSGRVGPGQPKFGKGRAEIAKNQDGTLDKMGQSRKGRSKTGK